MPDIYVRGHSHWMDKLSPEAVTQRMKTPKFARDYPCRPKPGDVVEIQPTGYFDRGFPATGCVFRVSDEIAKELLDGGPLQEEIEPAKEELVWDKELGDYITEKTPAKTEMRKKRRFSVPAEWVQPGQIVEIDKLAFLGALNDKQAELQASK